MQVPVYIVSYKYDDKTMYALIWEEKRQNKDQMIQKKKVIRKWQGNKMVYLEAPRKNDIPWNWIASCSSNYTYYKKEQKTCEEYGFTMFHFHSYELADSQEKRFIRR